MKTYLVGGMVRDNIMNVASKDADFSVVLEDSDFSSPNDDPFSVMHHHLISQGFKIYVETPEHYTIRAQFPGKNAFGVRDADFVLARQEGPYSDGRRPDWVKAGTLMDDLARRDFTMNAIAQDVDGTLIDPFNGKMDIAMKQIRAVGDPEERLREDALRAIRALRFSVVKAFKIDLSLSKAMESFVVWEAIRENISDERIQIELSKMFRFDTVRSIRILNQYPALTSAMFAGSVSLDSTMKLRG